MAVTTHPQTVPAGLAAPPMERPDFQIVPRAGLYAAAVAVVVLVVAMGIGLFAPPLGLGLYGACLIGNVPLEVTVKPMLGYLGLLLACLLVIAFTSS